MRRQRLPPVGGPAPGIGRLDLEGNEFLRKARPLFLHGFRGRARGLRGPEERGISSRFLFGSVASVFPGQNQLNLIAGQTGFAGNGFHGLSLVAAIEDDFAQEMG